MKIENIFRTNPSPFTVNTDFKSDVELDWSPIFKSPSSCPQQGYIWDNYES